MEDFLLTEFKEMYNQYRHLDTLRTRYVEYFTALTAAIVSATFVYGGGDFRKLASLWIFYFILFLIGAFTVWISISVRMRQETIAAYIMELREDMASSNDLKVVASVEICKTYKGWSLYESAILLILFQIFLVSVVLATAIFTTMYYYSASLQCLIGFLLFCLGMRFGIFLLSLKIATLLTYFASLSSLLVCFSTLAILFKMGMEKNDDNIKSVLKHKDDLNKQICYSQLRKELEKFKKDKNIP